MGNFERLIVIIIIIIIITVDFSLHFSPFDSYFWPFLESNF